MQELAFLPEVSESEIKYYDEFMGDWVILYSGGN